MNAPISRKAGWTARVLANRRRALVAGVMGLALFGLTIAQPVVSPNAVPAYAEAAGQAVTVPAQPHAFPSFADIVERVRPAVVSVSVRKSGRDGMIQFDGPQMNPFEGSPFEDLFKHFGRPGPDGRRGHGQRAPRAMSQGSGFFISADGYVVTNNHVVDGSDEVTVTLDDGDKLDARVIGTDDKTDLALLKVDTGRTFSFVEFSDTDIRVGDWVVAVGNPFGLGGTVTAGIVSARGRDIGSGPYDDYIQIDAPINRGNSGGPTFDLSGRVVGVNTAIFSPSGGSVGIGFAIPAAVARDVIADLKDDGSVTRGWLGVMIQPVGEDIAASVGLKTAAGAMVTEPQADSPAVSAGIASGDVIVAVNGRKVESPKELARLIAGFAPGTRVDLTIWRDGVEKRLGVTLGTLPGTVRVAATTSAPDAPAAESKIGLTLAPAAAVGAGTVGVAITGIDPDGPAAGKGISKGDVILDVGGKAVSTPGDVAKGIERTRAAGRKAVLMRVRSGDETRYVAVPLAAG